MSVHQSIGEHRGEGRLTMYVSILLLRNVIAELQRRGISADGLLAELRLGALESAGNCRRIPLDRVDALTIEALRLADDPYLGLAVGSNIPANALQSLSLLMVSCKTLRQAATYFLRYSPYLMDGVRWELLEEAESAQFIYERTGPEIATEPFAAEAIIAGAHRVWQHFARGLRPTEVTFKHRAPSAEPYESVFGCPVLFEQSTNALVFPAALLDLEQVYADDVLVQRLNEITWHHMRDQALGDTVADRVRVMLRYESDLSSVDLESVARRLGMATSTLRARLAADGSKLRDMLDAARCRLALEELKRADVNIKDLSHRVGFAERTAFHRAFRRWTGQTPAQFSASVGVQIADDDGEIEPKASSFEDCRRRVTK